MFKKFAACLILLMLAVLPVSEVKGWNRIERSVRYEDDGVTGRTNQDDLYGMDYAFGEHLAIDVDGALGDPIYPVAAGRVVEIREDWENGAGGDCQCFGNYVLIRHSYGHWLKQNNGIDVGVRGFVYSFYAHLAWESVLVDSGDWVSEDTQIAEMDDTGTSDGHHLHLQIAISEDLLENQGDWNENYDWAYEQTRNPEIWIPPYDYQGEQTATVMGRITESDGSPIENVIIKGIEKSDAGTVFPFDDGDLMTYDPNDGRTSLENPDDIFWENFATTDIAPGTYLLSAEEPDGTEYGLGEYTFRANRTTFVGQYPIYLPRVATTANYTIITLHNNHFTRAANVLITYLEPSGDVYDQSELTIAANDAVSPPLPGSFEGSAIISSSEDLSVVVEVFASNGRATYQGITPATGVGNPGWGRTGTTNFAPLILHDWYGWNTDLIIMNPGGDRPGTVTNLYQIESVDGTGEYGQKYTLLQEYLLPHQTRTHKSENFPASVPSGMFSAVVTSTVPTAVAAIYYHTDGSWMAANAFSEDYDFVDWLGNSYFNYLPQIKKDWWPNDSYIYIQNASPRSSACGIQRYYEHNEGDGDDFEGSSGVCDPYTSRLFLPENDISLNRFLGSAEGGVEDTSLHAAAVVLEADSDGTGSHPHALYNGFVSASELVFLPLIAKEGDTVSRTTGIMVMNTSDATANVDVTYRDRNTGTTYAESATIQPMRSQSFWQGDPNNPVVPDDFIGSAYISSDQPIVAVVNINSSLVTDGLRSYSGFNR